MDPYQNSRVLPIVPHAGHAGWQSRRLDYTRVLRDVSFCIKHLAKKYMAQFQVSTPSHDTHKPAPA